ncbi:MAG: protoporphyrinogen oxidase [Candidatus Eiseniibacteriota bacterium]
MSTPPRRRIAVVGAGLTGLAAARQLLEAGAGRPPADIVLFEAASRPGGIVSTVQRDDFVIEEGPDSFITDKPEALALCEKLGLSDSVIQVRPGSRTSFIVHRGRLVRTPESFQLLAPARLGPTLRSPLLSPLGKLRLAFEPFVAPRTRDRAGNSDESVASFITRRMGREVFERIAQPMVGGIYGADPETLSLAATFPRFLRMEAEHGSVVRGLRAAAQAASGPRYSLFASLARGMQSLTDALAGSLPPGVLRVSTPVKRIGPASPAGAGGWEVETSAGAQRFDAVLLAVPAAIAARLVEAFDPAIASALSGGASGSSVNVALAYDAGDIRHPMDGAGFVVPAIEGRPILGGSFVHRKFEGRAPEGKALLRIFLDARALELDDAEIVALVGREIVPLLGVEKAPLFAHVTRWREAMPHPRIGHLGRVADLRSRASRWPGLLLAGSSYDGVGLPDCVRSGESAARSLLEEGAPRAH